MTIRGDIKIITNETEVNNAIYAGFKVIALTENHNFGNMILSGTTLLPPYEALMAEMDNDIIRFQQIYSFHLAKKENDMFICAIIRALLEGINIVIYIPKDEAELMFSNVLVQYINDVYGITILPDTCMYNETYDAILVTKLYVYDLLTTEEFFTLYPIGPDLIYDEFLLQKLMMVMNPYVLDRTSAGYYTYFNDYMKHTKQNGNKMPIIPISYR